jgi:hypothetical protein
VPARTRPARTALHRNDFHHNKPPLSTHCACLDGPATVASRRDRGDRDGSMPEEVDWLVKPGARVIDVRQDDPEPYDNPDTWI